MQSLLNADNLGCEHGFMSELKMRFVLGLETATWDSITASQLYLTPDMRFTCNGMVTKWIIAANVNSDKPHTAELQLWRNTTNGVYERKNGTQITMTASPRAVYEFDNFSPIPFQAGDFLGLYLPLSEVITLYSEDTNSIINYYIGTGWSHDPLSSKINRTSLASSYFHPMVSVEISELGTSGSCRYTSSTGARSYLSDTRSVISTDNHPLIISKLNMSIKIPVTILHHIFTATKSASVSISSLMVCLFE